MRVIKGKWNKKVFQFIEIRKNFLNYICDVTWFAIIALLRETAVVLCYLFSLEFFYVIKEIYNTSKE